MRRFVWSCLEREVAGVIDSSNLIKLDRRIVGGP